MKRSKWSLRRLILGLSVEDAQSKFDTPKSRTILRVAHERFNQGIYHELLAAQRQRNGLAPDRKCHICRFTKPSVSGFQAYVKGSPEDYVIREVWEDSEDGVEPATSEVAALSHSSDITRAPCVSPKITQEQDAFKSSKALILRTLASALQLVVENVLLELRGRRESGALLSKEHQASVVQRLVDTGTELGAKSYKHLSSSSHLLEPVEMAVALCSRKNVAEMQAFKSSTFTVPAVEGGISYSLWVAGGLVASEELMEDFPFHLAKFVTAEKASSSPATRLPQVEVEIYFSSELFQLEKAVGQNGIRMLRSFIGRAMMKQHEPTPTSPTLLLAAAGTAERDLYNIYDPERENGEIRIPWIRKVVTKVSTVTGVVFSAEDSDENPTVDRMRASVSSVWRAWGHLVKDLHVHGDLDYLYVSISRRLEWEGNEGYIAELKELEAARDAEESAGPPVATVNVARTLNQLHTASFVAPEGAGKERKRYLPLAADFVVIECTLERKGLPHNAVVEDIVATLTDMQQEHMELQRLSVLDALASQVDESETKSGAGAAAAAARARDKVVPVLYEPKVVVSHAGTLENGTHSFQRLRIRGSCRAHVEALASALQEESGGYFTDRTLPVASASRSAASAGSGRAVHQAPPKNLTFRAVRAASDAQRLVGHAAPSTSEAGDKAGTSVSRGRHSRSQTLTSVADSFALVTEEERLFWQAHYYRLSDVKVIYHHRVDAVDALGQSWQSLPPRVQEHLALLNRRLSAGDATTDAADPEEEEDAGDTAAASGKRARRKGGKKKSRRTAASKKKPVSEAAAALDLPPQKLFEYLCTDMEAESARRDLKIGDCMGYDYLLSLRRIPDKHLPLVTPAIASVASKGFINYYGPQRFATYTRMNMHPGLHLLRGEYKAAAHILVQQFYLDAALEAERQRTGQAFPRMHGLQGYGGVRLPDFLSTGSRRSVAEHGTPMQRVLYNALQASAILGGDDSVRDGGLNGHGYGLGSGGSGEYERSLSPTAPRQRRGKGAMPTAVPGDLALDEEVATAAAVRGDGGVEDDPCAEAFLRVIGPRACTMLIQEFISFVWNDIVNQRLQRYGTFTLLPGDLVRGGGAMAAFAPDVASPSPPPLVYASRAEIERGALSVWDLVLPLPGAAVRLPQNHTEDLYIVTLQRYGLPFDPESRQWRCFQPSSLPRHGGAPARARTTTAGSGPDAQDPSSGGGAASLSPYHGLTSTFALMEEELGSRTPSTDAILPYGAPQATSSADANDEASGTEPSLDAGDLRPDLRAGGGNPLGLTVSASYRHPLVLPTAETMQWRLQKGVVGDPYRRWGMTTQAQVRANDAPQRALPDTKLAWNLPSKHAGDATAVAVAGGRAAPQPLRVESGGDLDEDDEGTVVEARRDGQASDGDAPGRGVHATAPSTTTDTPCPSSPATAAAAAARRSADPATNAAARTAAVYRHPRRWSGTSRLLRSLAPLSGRAVAHSHGGAPEGQQQRRPRRLRSPPAPSWLPRHHGSVLQLRLRLPAGVHPGMLVRELLKMDVSTPDVVDLDRAAAGARSDRRARSWQDLTPDQRATYEKWIAKRRQQRRFVQQPRAISLALLHQQIFRSSGVRQSLLPTLRSYDSVSK
ncbi:pseudouridine synthase TruD [Novymonas esmeraldas]|uniref:Pseudouridine synthase TruD n=1 Tax=Novymonas esmeraldas TaxID=1808958 RepID=A0AAW0EPJ8_9TRYP